MDTIVTIETRYDRSVRVRVGDHEIARTDYDEVGWAGLDAVTRTARGLAEALGATVEETEVEH